MKPSPSSDPWVDLDNDGNVDKEKLSPEQRAKDDKRADDVHLYIERIAEKKAKIRALERQNKEVNAPVNSNLSKMVTLQSEVQALENNMEKNIGIKKMEQKSADPEFGTQNTGANDIRFKAAIYTDLWNPGRWIMSGDWDWIDLGGIEREKHSSGNVGGNDGFFMRVDERIDVYSNKISTYWSSDGSKSNPEFFHDSTSQFGRGWRFQDVHRISGGPPTGYNVSYGMTSLSIKFEDPKVNAGNGTVVETSARYAHTWSETNISGVSIGKDGISIGFTKTANKWNTGNSWVEVLSR